MDHKKIGASTNLLKKKTEGLTAEEKSGTSRSFVKST